LHDVHAGKYGDKYSRQRRDHDDMPAAKRQNDDEREGYENPDDAPIHFLISILFLD